MPEGTLEEPHFVRFIEYGVALASSDACGAETRRLWGHGGTESIYVACGRRRCEDLVKERTPRLRVSIRFVFERRGHRLRAGKVQRDVRLLV